jgi:hypothetical protein
MIDDGHTFKMLFKAHCEELVGISTIFQFEFKAHAGLEVLDGSIYVPGKFDKLIFGPIEAKCIQDFWTLLNKLHHLGISLTLFIFFSKLSLSELCMNMIYVPVFLHKHVSQHAHLKMWEA